jgi:hypothetical protein
MDPLGYRCWNGNDHMILGYMQSQMYSAEIQYITPCLTAAQAFQTLCHRHEKRSGLTQIQLIQKLMQLSLKDNEDIYKTSMTTWWDLIYRIESIGHVDLQRLGLLFLFLNLKAELPGVHDTLALALMDGTISVELLEARMNMHFEMRKAHHGQPFLPPASLVLAAQGLPQRITLCPNCKHTGHTIEFCIAPGGKMEGASTFDAITHQRAAREASRQRYQPQGELTLTTTTPTSPEDVWIGGIRYRPDTTANVAITETSETQGELPDWVANNPDWAEHNSGDGFLDTDTILIASIDRAALISTLSDIPFFLDSGALNHISCLQSDFSTFHQLTEPHRISGVGNVSIYAVGIGTIELILPKTNTRLQLFNALFAPEATVRLVSIHQLNQLGYTTVFHSGRCQLSKEGNLLADCAPGPSNLYALPSSPPQTELALSSLQTVPDLEMWHRCLGHANHCTVMDMAWNGTAAGMTVDLSLAPQSCNHCVLGKQAHSPILKEQEGARSTC